MMSVLFPWIKKRIINLILRQNAEYFEMSMSDRLSQNRHIVLCYHF